MPDRLPYSLESPELDVEVAVGGALSAIAAPDNVKDAAGQIESAVGELMAVLGIPGRPGVKLIAADDAAHGLLRLRVEGELCRWPVDVLLDVYASLSGDLAARGLGSQDVESWLSTTRDAALPLRFAALLVVEILKLRPSVMFGPEQAAAYLNYLPELSAAVDPEQAAEALEEVLDHWFSIADRTALALYLAPSISGFEQNVAQQNIVQQNVFQANANPENARADGRRSAAELAEELRWVFRAEAIEILLHPESLRALSCSINEEDRGLFGLMRDGLFYELGMRYPNLRLLPAPDLHPGQVAFRLNHLRTLPLPTIGPEEVFVQAEMETFAMAVTTFRPALNPSNGFEGGVIDAVMQGLMPGGAQAYTPLGYLVLLLSSQLRSKAAFFLSREQVEGDLKLFGASFPELDQALRARWSPEQVTRALRLLAAEEISIRNFVQIVQAMVDFDYIVGDYDRLIVFDDRLPMAQPPESGWRGDARSLAAYARTCLKRYISHKYTRGQATLLVYLLSPEIEDYLLDPNAGADEDMDGRILDGVRSAVENGSADRNAVVLTTVEARAGARRLIAREFPRLAVVAYQELAPDMNIQPLARITID